MAKRKRGRACAFTRKKQKLNPNSEYLQSSSLVHDSVLTTYYQNVSTLGDLLQCWLPPTSRTRRRRLEHFDVNFPQHSGFLKQILVGSFTRPSLAIQNARRDELIAFTQTQRVARGDSHEQRVCDLGEIVDFTIWSLFGRDMSANKAPSHLLCHGFERSTSVREPQEQVQLLHLPGISLRTCNTNVEVLKRPPWTDVANLLGRDAETIVLNLLLDCGMFQQLGSVKHNLYQLSGEPVSQLTPFVVAGNESQSSLRHESAKLAAKPGSITFVRSRMLYARPSLSSQGKVQLGLKHIHILNRCHDLKDTAQDTRIMQYIFPLQFGLHNVFASKPNKKETVQPLKDYTMREQEIASLENVRSTKIPRRLRGAAVNLVQKLRKNHDRCCYTQLLRHYCPILDANRLTLPSSTEGLPKSSTTSRERFATQLRTQSSNLSSQDLSEPASTTSFIAHATPTSNVAAFCRAVILHILPNNVFGVGNGGNHNWQTLLQMIDQFVELRRYESMTLNQVCHGIKISCIDWLRPLNPLVGDKMSTSDKSKRQEILYEMMYYIFDSLLIPLIRSNFYVTETGVYRNRLYYFRHDVWKTLVEPSLAMMRLSMFEPLNARQLKHTLGSSSLGYSQMRLLPKEHGARPILNLKRRATKIVNGKPVLGPSINRLLAPVFSVLNLERRRQPERLASAMFSVGEIQHKLREFKKRLPPSQSRPLYFAKVDIQSCFDTIPQEELLKLVDALLQDHEYLISKHVELRPNLSKGSGTSFSVVKNYVTRAVPVGENPLLSSVVAARLADTKRQRVYSDVDHQWTMKTSRVRQMLNNHIQHNVVKFGRKVFRQVDGIPQGSVLSSLLCNMFYGDFEHQELSFLKPCDSLLLRLIDDFLLITTNEAQARQFVQAMWHGNTRHGISVNAEKSLVNFEVGINGHKIPRLHGVDYFPYCGMMIDTRDLQVCKDRRPRDPHVENGLTVARSGKVGAIMQGRIISSLKRQLSAILLDDSLNSRERVLKSIFECFVETGMKMHQYMKSLTRYQAPSLGYLIELCNQLLELGFKMVHRAQVNNPLLVTRTQMTWLGAAALSEVLARKQSGYPKLLGWLRNVERNGRKSMNMTTQELDCMVQGCTNLFAGHVY